MAAAPWGLALLLVCLSATHISGQEVTSKVSSTSLGLTWEKRDQWENVNVFHVTIKMKDFAFCDQTVYCVMSSKCTFESSTQCSNLLPCTDVSAKVRGSNYTAPGVKVVTAPSPVIDIGTEGLGNIKKIVWKNPDSSCLKGLTATVSFGGYLYYTSFLDPKETSLSVPLCMHGIGSVKVRTQGGDGESDPQTASLIRISGDESVKITECLPEDCTETVIDWEYNPLCPDVTTLEVTLGANFSFTTNATSSITSTTVTDLALNTLYDTCIYGRDAHGNLLARHCTKCGSQLEVVDELIVSNVTDTAVEFEWQPPVCPTGGNITYKVSCPVEGTQEISITGDTSFECSNLKATTNNKLCVEVLHPGVTSATQNCIKVFTLPSAVESVLARVYRESSLFITWPGDLLTPNFKYRVSWGDDLEHSDYTEYKSYTIDGYNKTVGPDRVCVEVETKNPTGKRSMMRCQESPYPNFKAEKPDHTNMIIGVSVSAGLAVLLSVVLVVVAKTQERPKRS